MLKPERELRKFECDTMGKRCLVSSVLENTNVLWLTRPDLRPCWSCGSWSQWGDCRATERGLWNWSRRKTGDRGSSNDGRSTEAFDIEIRCEINKYMRRPCVLTNMAPLLCPYRCHIPPFRRPWSKPGGYDMWILISYHGEEYKPTISIRFNKCPLRASNSDNFLCISAQL